MYGKVEGSQLLPHPFQNRRSCTASFLAAQLCHWRRGDLLLSHVLAFSFRGGTVGQRATRQRRARMASSAVAVAARAAVASAICVGSINARARLRDERSGRFAFAEAHGESDEDALPQVRTFRSYPRTSERRAPPEAFDDEINPESFRRAPPRALRVFSCPPRRHRRPRKSR